MGCFLRLEADLGQPARQRHLGPGSFRLETEFSDIPQCIKKVSTRTCGKACSVSLLRLLLYLIYLIFGMFSNCICL